ncbi:MAG: hypothetical protein JWL95_1087 [Gemmatimonadetes bacterium]|nr:hypothetical protein [Gemmatimonadota bacterium]
MQLEQFQWTPDRGWDRPPQASSLGASAQLVLMFGQAALVGTQDCAALVRTVFPGAHLFGCTGGVIHGARVGDETLTLTAIAFEHSRVATARARIDGTEGSFAAGESIVGQLDPEGLRHVFVLSEGLQVDSSALVRGINAATPDGVTVSGGFAGDSDAFEMTHVWCDGAPESSAAVALGFYGERLHVDVCVSAGWGPFGPDRVITKSRGNVLYEFDGRPALALYKQYLGEHAVDLPATGLMFPLELRTGTDGRVLRSLLAVDEEAQSITFAGDVPEGSIARLMVGHIEDLIDAAIVSARASRERQRIVRPELSLVVSCNARRTVLKQRVEEEMEAVQDALGAHSTLTGFYSYGEIAPSHAGSRAELHNETMAITLMSEV